MARHSTLKNAVFMLLCVGLLAIAAVASAQDTSEEDAAQEAMMARYERVNAPTDSLGFGVSSNDSSGLVPDLVLPRTGMMGLVERSPIAGTGFGKLFLKGGVFMWWLLTVSVIGLVFIIGKGRQRGKQ